MKRNSYGFIGLGLIGGSIAKAIRKIQPDCHILVYDTNTNMTQNALTEGIADAVTDSIGNDFHSCDMIFLCAPVSINNENLAQLKPYLSPDTLITDVGSVKSSIHDKVKELMEQRRAQGSNELSEDAKHQIDLLLKSKFRPEFLNRLDEIVYYKSLTKDEMRKIVDLQLQDLRNRMEEGKHLKLEVTTAAKDFIIDSAYDSVYGARPIKRFIQSRVETLIAKAIIKGSYAEGNTLTVDYDGSALVLR